MLKAALLITSLGSVAVVAGLVLVGGALTPGYSHASHFISELGASGAPLEGWVRFGGFLPAGMLLLAFCALAGYSIPRSRAALLGLAGLAVYAGGYLVAAFYPCDLGCRPAEPSVSQLIHNVGGFAGYLLAPGFLLLLASAARSWPGASVVVIGGYVAAGVALVGLLTLSPESAAVGISQRALEASVLGWVAVLGVHLAMRPAAAQL